MKKAMLILILAAMLTACGNMENTVKEEKAETSAVSQSTTTAAVLSPEAETTTPKTTSETTTKVVTTSETTSTSKATTTTTKSETTTSKATTKKSVSETTTTRQPIQQTEAQTYIVYYDEPAPETQQTEVKVTETATTTVQTSPPNTTTTPKQTSAASSGIEWSDSMKVWRKLCEGKTLSGGEQDMIRSEILDYAVSTFNGKKDIHISFGIDSYDISYEKPLNLTINRSMTGMENAHMDAYADANRKAMINYASSEQEIYDIVSDTRQSCLHVIDYGLFGRWEIMSMNGSLKYASNIEFNVGFDEDMTIWFLTQD